jgi:hypothetical protein
MSKDRGRNDERRRIAHIAARIMVEDGVEDYALAKRKAARQAGAADTRQLPTNEEIEAALRTHQTLFEGAVHEQRVRDLRCHALGIMRLLDAFNPHLTGSVLSGSAGKYADINLHLYTDSSKAVELFLIDNDVSYRAGQRRLFCGDELRTFPVFTFDDTGVPVELLVLALDDLRHPIKSTREGKVMERARRQVVERLCESA